MPIHFERGWFLYDAQEWENLEMRGWGRCLRKTKLHFVRKDKFIDICFGEYKRLSWDLYWVLCPEEFYYWLIKVVRKQMVRMRSGKFNICTMQYLWFGFAFEEVLSCNKVGSWFKQWTSHTLGSFQNSDPGCRPQSVRGGHHWFLWRTVSTYKPIKAI